MTVKKLKVKKVVRLPARTQQDAAVTWTSLTVRVCTVKGAKITALRKGTCRVKASAPELPGYSARARTIRLKVT